MHTLTNYFSSKSVILPCWFQSARPRGARPAMYAASMGVVLFQSTRPRGARRHKSCYPRWLLSFNPRAREGRDGDDISGASREVLFQSTRPRGARRHSCSLSTASVVFQSTRPRGARPSSIMRPLSEAMFQSTRPRGARLLMIIFQ